MDRLGHEACRKQGDNSDAGIGVWGCKRGPRDMWSPAARAEGLAGLGAVLCDGKEGAVLELFTGHALSPATSPR